MTSTPPSPYEYLDYRAFLGAWFEAKKAANPRYSYRLFARRAGTSGSLLHHVITGHRNLTSATAEAFVSALGLRAGEARFFKLLVEFDSTEDAETKNVLWRRIRTTRRFREARGLDGLAVEYLSSWVGPAVRELASHPAFQCDATWVASRLCPSISVSEARAALEMLQRLGLLVQRDGQWVPAETSVATPPEVTGLAVGNYHRSMIDRARESIERFEPEERHVLAVTVSVPAELVPTLKAEATAMMQRLMTLCDDAEGPPDQVVQLNLQLFPLSQRLSEETP